MKWLLVFAVIACTPSYRRCPEPRHVEQLPSRLLLSQTGFFDEERASFEPRFPLWSDGATKRRWIRLPPGAQVDKRDPDAWQFPQGTKLWKEFTRDGVRVETRFLEKVGPKPADWFAVAFVWNAENTDATAAPLGAPDAKGTRHDVPSARECFGCHDGAESRVLGFSAVQLGEVEPPGDAQTKQVLGYLHGNCAHCHNQHRPLRGVDRCYDPKRALDLSLRTGQLTTLEDTPLWKTAGPNLVCGDPEASGLYKRARGDLRAFQARMPPLATEELDPSLLPMLHAWIASGCGNGT